MSSRRLSVSSLVVPPNNLKDLKEMQCCFIKLASSNNNNTKQTRMIVKIEIVFKVFFNATSDG